MLFTVNTESIEKSRCYIMKNPYYTLNLDFKIHMNIFNHFPSFRYNYLRKVLTYLFY